MLRTLEPLVRQLIETVVGQLTLVGDETDLDGLRHRRCRVTGRDTGDRGEPRSIPAATIAPTLLFIVRAFPLVLAYES